MKNVIFAVIAILTVSSQAFCGEIIRTGLEIKDGNYFIDFEIKVDITKEQAMRIFNDSEKLKTLSYVIERVTIIEKQENDLVKQVRVINFCLPFVCMKTFQNTVPETGDNDIEIIVPEQTNFGQSKMHITVFEDMDNKTIIKCKLEVKPQFFTKGVLVLVTKGMIERKLVEVGNNLIDKIKNVAAENNNVVKEGK